MLQIKYTQKVKAEKVSVNPWRGEKKRKTVLGRRCCPTPFGEPLFLTNEDLGTWETTSEGWDDTTLRVVSKRG